MRGWLRAAEDREDTVSAQPTAAAAGTIGIGGDLTVNRMGFGAMRITGRGIWGEPPSRDRAIATLRRVVELGVNFIDTADSYGPSVSEELIAAALYPYPDDLVIATKGGMARPGPNRWNPDGRPEHLREACEGSLRRLRLEQIPLWQLHRPDPKVPLAESMGVIAELKDEGKIRHVGISNVSEAQFREAERIVPIVSIQNRFNVTDRESQPLIDLCEQQDMVFLPWAPIQQAERRVAVAVAAERRGATERQIVLAWLLAISPAIVPIPGTGSPEHAEENVAATAIELSRDELEAISKGGLPRRTDESLKKALGRSPPRESDLHGPGRHQSSSSRPCHRYKLPRHAPTIRLRAIQYLCGGYLTAQPAEVNERPRAPMICVVHAAEPAPSALAAGHSAEPCRSIPSAACRVARRAAHPGLRLLPRRAA